eukprot:163981-Karenia_brevis.AAC.1
MSQNVMEPFYDGIGDLFTPMCGGRGKISNNVRKIMIDRSLPNCKDSTQYGGVRGVGNRVDMMLGNPFKIKA